MSNVMLLLFCLAVGVVLRTSGRVPADGHQAINAFVINISLPALALLQIPKLPFSSSLLIPISMPWLMFAIVAAVLWTICNRAGLRRTTTGALILTAGLANTSFMGVPMIEAFYGQSYTGIGLLIDQLGTYLVLSTLGLLIACLCSEGTASAGEIARRVVTFPPLVALVVASALAAGQIAYPPIVTNLLERLAATLAPLALVSVGLQLRLGALRGYLPELSCGLAIKLLAAPLLLVLLYIGLVGVQGDLARVTIFEAAMGPQIGGAIVATQYDLDPPLVTLMVGIGTLMAFVSLPAWWYLLQFA
jgi:malate permease and related proteins